MKWRGRRGSGNVRRGGLGRGGLAVGGGLGTVIIVLLLALTGGDPTSVLQTGDDTGPASQQEAEQEEFVSVVLADTEEVWAQVFQDELGSAYQEPTLVIFRDQVQSACGFANAAVGPFYCPADATVYIDLSFYDELAGRHDAPGDFAQAYVIAHEVGHHVQNLLGISDQVQQQRGQVSEEEANDLSVRLELQADFMAGLWANRAQQNWDILEPGDLEEALNAASAIGDDRLQREAQGYVVPDSFTHGTSEQRARWFRRGFETGDIEQGDTFAAERL
jgi:predicted metalloprotease